jgi:hypothetical protein
MNLARGAPGTFDLRTPGLGGPVVRERVRAQLPEIHVLGAGSRTA